MAIKEEVRTKLTEINYPGIGRDIVSLGFIKGIAINDGVAELDFAPTTTKKGIVAELKAKIEKRLLEVEAVNEVRINLHKPQKPEKKAPQKNTLPDKKPIEGVKHIIAVASGKGGVGKSTVAVNLAAAFSNAGKRTGLLDLDVYGPSAPTMFNLHKERPQVGGAKNDKIVPLKYRDLQVMSLGFVIDPEEPVIWRGPMVVKAVQQLLQDVSWEKLDYLVIDLPPGTGDTLLSMLQLIPLSGALIVTTPQEVALSDVRKSAEMFKKMNTPLLGIVENMASHVCPECGHQSAIFGQGGGTQEAERLGIELLGQIPLKQQVRAGGDAGEPVVFSEPDSEASRVFEQICRKLQKKTQTVYNANKNQSSAPE